MCQSKSKLNHVNKLLESNPLSLQVFENLGFLGSLVISLSCGPYGLQESTSLLTTISGSRKRFIKLYLDHLEYIRIAWTKALENMKKGF